MSSRLAARITGTELGVRPRNYGHLQGLAARYARARLDGRAVVNRATQQPILLDWRRGLSEATAPGSAPELLLSLPALPSLLANARYLGSGEDPRRRPDVQQLHSFGATVDVTGRPIELRLIAREDRHGRLYVDGIVPCSPLVAPRADGGTLPDSAGARSCALRAVLDRATFSARREGGGATPSMDASSSRPKSPIRPRFRRSGRALRSHLVSTLQRIRVIPQQTGLALLLATRARRMRRARRMLRRVGMRRKSATGWQQRFRRTIRSMRFCSRTAGSCFRRKACRE
jgi:hypothetical protein